MPKKLKDYFLEDEVFACNECKTHLAECRKVKSDDFTGSTGQATLISDVVNVLEGE